MSKENKPLLSEWMETLEQITERATREAKTITDGLPEPSGSISRLWNTGFETGYIAGVIAEAARNEQARTKDRELIQTLVGELIQSRASILGWIPDELTPMAHQMKIALKRINSALTLAGEQGHKPTEK